MKPVGDWYSVMPHNSGNVDRDLVESSYPMETHARSIVKTISYRILGSVSTALIFYGLTGKVSLSISAGAMDAVVKLGVYFVHERIWAHIPYGRSKSTEYEILSVPTRTQGVSETAHL